MPACHQVCPQKSTKCSDGWCWLGQSGKDDEHTHMHPHHTSNVHESDCHFTTPSVIPSCIMLCTLSSPHPLSPHTPSPVMFIITPPNHLIHHHLQCSSSPHLITSYPITSNVHHHLTHYHLIHHHLQCSSSPHPLSPHTPSPPMFIIAPPNHLIHHHLQCSSSPHPLSPHTPSPLIIHTFIYI